MKIKDFTPKNHTASFPIRGYVVREQEKQIWIQDQEGTWIIDEKDIVGKENWAGGLPRFSDKPVCFFLREGAEILEVRPYQVKLQNRPLTLDPVAPPREGTESTTESALKYARHLGFKPGGSDPKQTVYGGHGEHTTVCCWVDSGGMTCQADDCGPPIWQTM